MFKILVSSRASKKLKLLRRSHQEAIVSALEEIKEDPLIGKPLTKELAGRFSYRVGVYRIIYRVNQEDKTIQVLNAGHRTNIYK